MRLFFSAVLLFISSHALADPWLPEDTDRETAYLAVLAVDWAQTRGQARNHWKGYYEMNPLLGSDSPSIDRVNIVCVTSGIAHYYISKALPEKWRTRFQYVTIGLEGSAVAYNFSIGVRAKF